MQNVNHRRGKEEEGSRSEREREREKENARRTGEGLVALRVPGEAGGLSQRAGREVAALAKGRRAVVHVARKRQHRHCGRKVGEGGKGKGG